MKCPPSGSPDATQGPARTARAFATTYLAWGRLAAQEAGRKEEAENLAARLSLIDEQIGALGDAIEARSFRFVLAQFTFQRERPRIPLTPAGNHPAVIASAIKR